MMKISIYQAMTALMGKMSWQRILIVYSDNDYGRDLMKEFVRQSQYESVCVVEAIAVPASPDVTEYGNILQNIGKYHVSGAAYFGDHYSMKIVSRYNCFMFYQEYGKT